MTTSARKTRKCRGYRRKRGSGKRNRGAGNRGGKGRAGLGKRAAQNKLMYLTNPDLKMIGKHGFTSIYKKTVKTINVEQLDKIIDKFVEAKKASFDKKVYTINLKTVGFNKLLGTGRVTKKMNITVESASPGAVAKVEEAGGKIEANSKEAEESGEEHDAEIEEEA